MALTYIKGNILDWPGCEDNDFVYNLQQANNCGVFNAGLAKETRIKYPEVYKAYIRYHKSYLKKGMKVPLGSVIFSSSKSYSWDDPFKPRFFALLVAQETYGRTGKHTNLDALEKCFVAVKEEIESRKKITDHPPIKVLIPYGMGCGLGGEKWSNVEPLIQQHLPNAIIVKYEKAN